MVSPTTLLSTWEAGRATGESDRAILLHALVHPDADRAELAAMPATVRNVELIGLGRELFGGSASYRFECTRCGERMAFELDPGQLPVRAPDSGAELGGSGERRLSIGEWTVRYRLLTPEDVSIAKSGNPERAGKVLLARCLLSASRSGVPVPVWEVPQDVVAQVAQAAAAQVAQAAAGRIAQAAAAGYPRADPPIEAPCPACRAWTPVVLDVVPALWSELDAWAKAALLDVHLLAGAYGWTEPQVLALSPARRRYYLDLIADA